MRGWYGMGCWNGLSDEQQRMLIDTGVLPFGRWQPEGDTCERGAEVEVTTMWDRSPGPRFYCTQCAIDYLDSLLPNEPATYRRNTMNTYTITLTGVFDAENVEEACEGFREWAAMPGCVEAGATITVAPAADEVWASLSPAAKADWVRAMMPEPEPEPGGPSPR